MALPSSVLVPDHRFLSWSGFVKDGQWKLAVQAPTKDKGGYLRLESRRWTFVTKQIEGTYPNWRNITDDVQQFSGYIEISDQAAEAIGRIVPRLPGDDTPNHTVGLYTCRAGSTCAAANKDQERATEVEVPGVKISGDPATVYLNRQYLLKAIGFGLRTIGVQEPLKPLRFSDGGSRQMIVMPVRVDANASAPSNRTPASTPSAPSPRSRRPPMPGRINPQPSTPTHNHNPKKGTPHPCRTEPQPPTAAGTSPPPSTKAPRPRRNPASNRRSTRSRASRAACGSAVGSLNNLIDIVRQVQRERRVSEREVRSVRDTLKSAPDRAPVVRQPTTPSPERRRKGRMPLLPGRCPALRRVHPTNPQKPPNHQNRKNRESMSHNLMIQNGEASMMYVGGVPWHGLGTALDQPATAEEAIQAARLDWQVKKLPLYASDGPESLLRLPVPDKYAVGPREQSRCARRRGQQLHPVQNREAFAFFDPIVGKQAAVYHTAGALGQRRARVDPGQAAGLHPGGRR